MQSSENDYQDYFDWERLKTDLQLAALFMDKDALLFLLTGLKRHLKNHDAMYRCTPEEFRRLDTILTDAALCSKCRLWSIVQKAAEWLLNYQASVYRQAWNMPIKELRFPLTRGSMFSADEQTASMYLVVH